jgi:hypothetical protein
MTIFIGEEAWRGCEELRLLMGLNLQEVGVMPQTVESPRRQLQRVVHAEGEAVATDVELSIDGAIGGHADVAEVGQTVVVQRHPRSSARERRRSDGLVHEVSQRLSDARVDAL